MTKIPANREVKCKMFWSDMQCCDWINKTSKTWPLFIVAVRANEKQIMLYYYLDI